MHCDIPLGDRFDAARAKKVLQAEFNIADGGMIEVDGYTYTRHAVMEEIDNPRFSQRLAYHARIWERPALLKFLETNAYDPGPFKTDLEKFTNDLPFDDFISPFLAGPYNYASRNLLLNNDLETAATLLHFEQFIQPADREDAFRAVKSYLEDNIRTLRNVKGANYEIMRPQILHWIERDWCDFISSLPTEFYDDKLNIVRMLVNIGVEIQKKNRSDCRKTSAQLACVTDLPTDLGSLIRSNDAIYNGAGAGGTTSSGRKNSWIVGVGLFILIRVILSNGCDDTSSNNDFKYAPIQFKYTDTSGTPKTLHLDTSNFREFDSLMKEARKQQRKNN